MRKGQEALQSFLMFLGEVILLLVLLYWTASVGTEMLNYFLTIDSRIIQESLATYYTAAEISNSTFSSSIVIPPAPHILRVWNENGYRVWVSTRQDEPIKPPSMPEVKPEIRIKKVREIPFLHFGEFNKIPQEQIIEFNNQKIKIFVKRDDAGNIKSDKEVVE